MFCSHLKIGVLLLCVMPHLCQTQAQQSSSAKIILPSQVAVNSYVVTLGAVADITCDNPILRRKLSELDIAEITTGKSATVVKQSFIRIRLQLAGIERSRFVLDGADKCQIEYTAPKMLTDADVEAAGAVAFHESLGGSLKDIRVRLTAPFVAPLPAGIRERPGLRAVAMPPTRGNLGEVSTLMQLWDGKSLVLSKSTRFEVLQRQTVAVTLASFSRDQPIELGNLKLEDRFVSEAQDQPVENDLRGKIARRDIAPGQVLSLNDLKAAPTTRQRIAVKARDTVRVEAISGKLRVRLKSAVAMDSGSVGDTIRFKNPDSEKIGSGRIVGHGLLQIQL